MKRKIVNKLLAICLSISMIAGTGLPVTAAGTENTPQTTVTTEATTEKTTSSTSTLYKVKLTLPGITAATSVKSLSVKQNGKDYTYDYKDLKTDDKGVLYLKLPANAKGQTTSITVNDVSYSGTVNANDDNAFAAPPAKTESEKTTEKATEKATENTTASPETETAKGTEAATEPTESTEKKSPETEPVTDTKATEESKAPDTEAPDTESQKATETTGQTGSNNKTPGESETTDTNGSHKASAIDNIKIDYPNETLTNVTADMEYIIDGNETWNDCLVEGQGMKIKEGMFGHNLTFRIKGTTDKSTPIQIQSKDKAPEVTTPGASTIEVQVVGNVVYQYRLETNPTWSDITTVSDNKAKITGLAIGTYRVRTKATATSFASNESSVVISPKLSLAKPIFSPKPYGYGKVTFPISLKNTGNAVAKPVSISLVGDNKDDFEVKEGKDFDKISIPVNNSKGVEIGTVNQKEGLDLGTYKATIVVTYDNGKTATTDISFTVNKMKVTPTVKSVNDKIYDKTKDAKGTLELKAQSGSKFPDNEIPKIESYDIKFDSADAGKNQKVTVTKIQLEDKYLNHYELSTDELKSVKTDAEIKKAKNPKTLSKAEVSSFTYNSITMKNISGVEYAIDNDEKFDSTYTFNGLKEKSKYKIYARYEGTKNYEPSKSVSVEQTTLRNPIKSNPQNNKITGVQTTTSYKTGTNLSFTATGAGSEIKSPSLPPSLDDERYIPISWSSNGNGASWNNNSVSNTANFNVGSAINSRNLSVTFRKQIYDGTNWIDQTQVTDTKSVSYKVVTSTTTSSTNKNTTNKTGVKTGDVNPIMLMVILLVVSGAVIVVLVVRTRSKRRQHRE